MFPFVGILLVVLTDKTVASLVESTMLRGALPKQVVPSTAAPAVNETWDFPFPDYRYTEWSLLNATSRNAAQTALSYNETTWNVPYTNPLEELWWGGLDPTQQAGANVIGFVDPEGEVWDCYQNHYNDYDWNELQEDGLDVPYITLGWTKESWEGKAPEPASENKTWSNLTLVEQQAADEVCYFLETWDQISMVNWTTDTTTMATPVSTIAPPATTVAIGTTSDSGAPTSVDSSTVRATTTLPV